MRNQLPQDPALLALRPLPVTALVPPQAVEYLFTCCIADRVLMRDAQQKLCSHHFDLTERPLAVTWDILCQAADNNWPVTWELLCCQLASALQLDPGLLTQDQIGVMSQGDEAGLFWSLTHPVTEVTSATTRYARNVLRSFLMERTVTKPMQKLAQLSYGDGCIGDVQPMLEALHKQQAQLTTMDAVPMVSSTVVRGTPRKPDLEYLPTGVRFIDDAVGGETAGDVNGLLGPTGGGKTTLSMHMAVSTARLAYSQAISANRKPPMVVYATYEQSAATRLRPSLWSVAYQIPRAKLMQLGGNWDQLTTQANLDPYERTLLGNDPNYPTAPLSETERWDIESEWLETSFVFLDMSGCEEHPTAGNGGLPELVSYLDRLQNEREQPIRSVHIDYAGLLISGLANATGINEDSTTRKMLRDLGVQCRRQISEHFRCTTWLLHQMAGAACKASPTKLLTHLDAADCKNIAENMTLCGNLGTEDKQSGCRRLNWSKTRYNVAPPPVTLRIHPQFALMEDVTTRFTPDTSRGCFLTAEDSRRIAGTAAPRRQAGPRGLAVGTGADMAQVDRSTV